MSKKKRNAAALQPIEPVTIEAGSPEPGQRNSVLATELLNSLNGHSIDAIQWDSESLSWKVTLG
jgi:hypothetical protein